MNQKNNWHAQDISNILTIIKGSLNGLSTKEAEHRLNLYGANELETFKRPNAIARFLQQFHNILIYVLLISAVITLLLEYFIDSAVILGVLILNAFFGFIQEGKAEKAIESIREMLAPNANIIRDGERHIVPAKSLVVGDIVLIKSGDKVPADLRLLDSKNLQIQEAILTGESHASEKHSEPAPLDTPLSDRFSMAYSGTTVTYGKGTGIVVATGINTEIGKIGTLLKKIGPITTPLLKQMNVFGRWLTLAITALAALTFSIGILIWNDPTEQMFMAAVSVAVAAIPEGLPPILTIILAIGATRMAKNNAIIRQLPAVETMGAITTICTDKTGTLTLNEQTIKNIITAKNCYDVEKDGTVEFSLNNQLISLEDYGDLRLAINAAILCNDTEFSKDSRGQWHIHGNPIDKAFLDLGGKAKIDLQFLQQSYPRSDLIPYESEHKFMATLHHNHLGRGFIYIKGAPENILAKCSAERANGETKPLNYNFWYKNTDQLARKGYRVIAIAFKELPEEKPNLLFEDITENLTLIAVFGLIDAPRPEAIQAVEQCYEAGIKVKMITGDHAITASTIADQVGIKNKTRVLTGNDIDLLDDDTLANTVDDVNIYARTTPQHKLRLVKILQKKGELVAMTGDGVNDAPALRKADIGIAMGRKGAEIAKEASAMVLADDNFATIVQAIKEGRIIYDNLKKIILLILPTNAAEAFTIVMAIIFGFVLPITPVQILWINMITAVTLAIALGFEPAENDVMHRAPRKAKASILSTFLIWRIVFVSALLMACVFGSFIVQRKMGVDLNTARTMAVNMLVLGEAIYLLNCRKLKFSVLNRKIFLENKLILLAIITTLLLQLLFTYLPTMQHFFGTKAITTTQWLYIFLLSLGVFILVEFEKFLIRRFVTYRNSTKSKSKS